MDHAAPSGALSLGLSAWIPSLNPLGSGAREGWVLCFSGTGQDCAHTWGWQENRELFFMEQLELGEGVRTCPRDPPVTGQPQQDGKQQECWPASLSAALGATVPFLLAWQNQGVFPSPSPLFLPPLHHLVLPWGEWCCRGKPHPDKIMVGWHCWNSEGSGGCLELELNC